jgi:hypothetical protein
MSRSLGVAAALSDVRARAGLVTFTLQCAVQPPSTGSAIFGVLGQNVQDGRDFRKCRLASETIGCRYCGSLSLRTPIG